MQNAVLAELLLMSQCSLKKAQAIIDARPFEDWRDLVNKFQNTKYLDTELLNAAQVNLKKITYEINDIFIFYKIIRIQEKGLIFVKFKIFS